MAKASVLVLSSAWEGFGNVLVEAMISGTAVVSTDCESGPAEILANGKFGRLVEVGNAEEMAKAILEFDLNEQDDIVAHKRAVKALDLCLALWDVDQYLRAQTKYAPDSMPEDVFIALSKAREEFYDIMNEHSVSLDELLK